MGTITNNKARLFPGDDNSFNEMEDIKHKTAELCEAVAAKKGNMIIIGDVEDNEFQTLICRIQGDAHALAMDMARIAHRKEGEPVRGIMDSANVLLDFIEKVAEAEACVEVINEATE